MAHTDVKAALAHGVNLINQWAAAEFAKIDATPILGLDGLNHELAAANQAASIPNKFFHVPLVLRNGHGDSLSMNDANPPVFKRSPNRAGWEQFRLEPASAPGKFFIRSATHDFGIGASDNKTTITPTKNRAGWEEWTLVPHNGKFLLKAWTGQNLSQSDNGSLSQSPNSAGWELWQVEYANPSQDPTAKIAEVQAKITHAQQAAVAQKEGQKAQLKAAVDQRVAAKNQLAAQIEGQLAQLAA